VIGANDVTTRRRRRQTSRLRHAGLQVWKAGTVMFIKRSLASGYAASTIRCSTATTP